MGFLLTATGDSEKIAEKVKVWIEDALDAT